VQKLINTLKYLPKVWFALSYLVIVIIGMVLFFGRNFDEIRVAYILHFLPNFYSHVSNFSISLILLATIGYIGLLMGFSLKHLVITSLVLVVSNLIVESLFTILNTPDLTDALYGSCGVLLGFIFLTLAKVFGLKYNHLKT